MCEGLRVVVHSFMWVSAALAVPAWLPFACLSSRLWYVLRCVRDPCWVANVPYCVAGVGLTNIALAKAGIMKQGRPVVLGHQPEPEAEAQLLRSAELLACLVTRADQAVSIEPQGFRPAGSTWRQHVQIQHTFGMDCGMYCGMVYPRIPVRYMYG